MDHTNAYVILDLWSKISMNVLEITSMPLWGKRRAEVMGIIVHPTTTQDLFYHRSSRSGSRLKIEKNNHKCGKITNIGSTLHCNCCCSTTTTQMTLRLDPRTRTPPSSAWPSPTWGRSWRCVRYIAGSGRTLPTTDTATDVGRWDERWWVQWDMICGSYIKGQNSAKFTD